MAKLYPPIIDGKVPAFSGKYITVPFQLNRAVGREEFTKMSLLIKNVQSNIQQAIISTTSINYDINNDCYYAIFDIEDSFVPLVGQYYKVQIACVQREEIGYYSDIGVTKCTAQPQMGINNLNSSATNFNQYSYTGTYSNLDKTEKVYSYKFDLLDNNSNLILSSGELLHNNSLDTEANESRDTWNLEYNLSEYEVYYIVYSVTTLNGLKVSTPKYPIINANTIDMKVSVDLCATLNQEEGTIQIKLATKKNEIPRPILGRFVLLRSSSEDNYENWNEIYRFTILSKTPEQIGNIWEDYTVRQGESYKYAIEAYNPKGIRTKKLLNKEGPIEVDFEDMFLFDGERQLKIKFNPKVSSFKNTILETKTDTIGGKYAYFFRNGDVEYKEFPLSGLISMLADPAESFRSGSQFPHDASGRKCTPTKEKVLDYNKTNLTARNIFNEREFKLDVFSWLQNGKPKLFRSATEGNYIVRLMNVSLTPNDTLGRMLHTFNATAYEMAEFNFKSLREYNLLKCPIVNNNLLRFEQIDLLYMADDLFNFNNRNIYYAEIQDALAENIYILNYEKQKNVEFTTPITGNFIIPISVDNPLISIQLKEGYNATKGVLKYAYYDNLENAIGLHEINNITLNTRIVQLSGKGEQYNLIKDLTDARRQVGWVYFIRITPKNIVNIYSNSEKGWCFDAAGNNPVNGAWNPSYLYYNEKNNLYYVWDNQRNPNSNQVSEQISRIPEPTYNLIINDNYTLDLSGRQYDEPVTLGREEIRLLKEVNTLNAGTGLVIDIVYQEKLIEYVLEHVYNKTNIDEIEQKYNEALEDLKNTIFETEADRAYAEQQLKNYYDKLLEDNRAIINNPIKQAKDTVAEKLRRLEVLQMEYNTIWQSYEAHVDKLEELQKEIDKLQLEYDELERIILDIKVSYNETNEEIPADVQDVLDNYEGQLIILKDKITTCQNEYEIEKEEINTIDYDSQLNDILSQQIIAMQEYRQAENNLTIEIEKAINEQIKGDGMVYAL